MLPGKKYSPDDIVRVARRRWWLPVVTTGVCLAAGLAGLAAVADQYRADTLILVVPQRVPDSYVRSTVTARIEDRLNSISQQILSRSRLESIIGELNLYTDLRASRPMEDVVERMRRDIKVDTVRGDAFRVSYTAPDPGVVQKVTERLAGLFIEENLRDREVLAEATNRFLESQLEEARVRLVEHEKRLEAYRLEHDGELPSQSNATLQAMQSTQSRVQALVDTIARDRDRRLILERSVADLERNADAADAAPDASAAGAGLDEAMAGGTVAQQLAAARQALRALETRLRPEHPDIVRTRRVIAELEARSTQEQAAQVTDAGRPLPLTPSRQRVNELRAELQALDRAVAAREGEVSRLQARLGQLQDRLDAMPTRESEMTELTRDYETLRKVYTDLLAKREDSKVAANLERRQIGEQFRILDPARRPQRPVSPNRPLVAGGAALLGLLVGIGVIVLLEVRDRTFRSESDVVAVTGVPVLASIPQVRTASEAARRRVRVLTAAVGGALAVVGLSVATWFVVVR